MIRRFEIPKTEYYEDYVENCRNENILPEKREEFDIQTRESLKEQYPTREIEGQIGVIENDTERTEEAWFHWEYDYNHYCDCDHCNDETELIY
jgi:hypothetical protein